MLTFVIFFVDFPKEMWSKIRTFSENYSKIDPYQIIDIVFKSAELSNPGCKKVIITDQFTQFPMGPEVEIFRTDIDPKTLIFSRAVGKKIFLERYRGSSHILFLDCDIIVQSNLESLFQKDFDVGFTYDRSPQGALVLASVHLVHGNNIMNALKFQENVLKCMLQKHKKYLIWKGDTYSYHTLIGRPHLKGRESHIFSVKVDEIDVLLLPANIYNFCPNPDVYIDFFLKKKIIHFKKYGILKQAIVYSRHKILHSYNGESENNETWRGLPLEAALVSFAGDL